VQRYLARFAPAPRVLPFLTDAAQRYLEAAGLRLVDGRNGASVDAVFVAQPRDVDFDELERAARAVLAGARLLTGSYVPAYAGADGPIFSRGAMLTAALAKATGVRPVVVGKPSRPAVQELETRLGVPSQQTAVVGDDLSLDVRLGQLGGSVTVLVRSGISGELDLGSLRAGRRPHVTVDTVADLLDRL
jgi:5'-nucleotidase